MPVLNLKAFKIHLLFPTKIFTLYLEDNSIYYITFKMESFNFVSLIFTNINIKTTKTFSATLTFELPNAERQVNLLVI